MVNITGRVTLVSKDGAGPTVLDAGGDALAVACIGTPGASGTVFGKPNKGFTLRNGQYGLNVLDDTNRDGRNNCWRRCPCLRRWSRRKQVGKFATTWQHSHHD